MIVGTSRASDSVRRRSLFYSFLSPTLEFTSSNVLFPSVHAMIIAVFLIPLTIIWLVELPRYLKFTLRKDPDNTPFLRHQRKRN